MSWLRSSDVVVAECSSVSLGVGYELGQAEALGKPVLILYRSALRQEGARLSAMLTGNPYTKQRVVYYEDEEAARRAIDEWIAPHKAAAGAASAGAAAAAATTCSAQ
jgi:nucleoside 2-deoxyribosyltransferase